MKTDNRSNNHALKAPSSKNPHNPRGSTYFVFHKFVSRYTFLKGANFRYFSWRIKDRQRFTESTTLDL